MPYCHLALEERYVIYHLVLYGLSYREIGRRLGRHHTTISREVTRNRHPLDEDAVYWHEAAQDWANAKYILEVFSGLRMNPIAYTRRYQTYIGIERCCRLLGRKQPVS